MKGPQTKVKLSEYTKYPAEIPNIYIDFIINDNDVDVISSMTIIPINNKSKKLILNGIDIKLKGIKINQQDLDKDKFKLLDGKLIINDIPDQEFNLEIKTSINPFLNSSLEGLYSSERIITTQCEAEGFRRICFHPDRPDVLSRYKVRIEADIKKYPILLSNGNNISSKILTINSSRHEVIWEDPFPKPSYLFALVAGDLRRSSSAYQTLSGRNITINIYVEEGDEEYTQHAIDSLKKSMRWDEEVYNLEYDLNTYNIVAIRHFNMGAMENKSLNIFNSKLVLADSRITTDGELERIESVIGHEYFHNWTGNRITCRDWFQLSLKEGLTVFRDQSFTSYLHSSTVKRIEDVSLLRSTQFKEDSGPTSHPVKPSEYISIDNFYTTTIYEKGAEIIRMLQTLLGQEYFMKGMSEYIKRHDGSAATTEDFVYAITEGASDSGCNINFNVPQFINWYYQSGTPNISIKREWNSKEGSLSIIIKQGINTQNQGEKATPLVIPIRLGIINQDKEELKELTLILEKQEQTYKFNDLPKKTQPPLISLFRNFSAPVKWESDLSLEELFKLGQCDKDLFSRWDAVQEISRRVLISRSLGAPCSKTEGWLTDLYRENISMFKETNKEFLAAILTVPKVDELEIFQEVVDPVRLYRSYIHMLKQIGENLSDELNNLLEKHLESASKIWPEGKAERKLMEIIWSFLVLNENQSIRTSCLESVKGNSMTLTRSALNALSPIDCLERDEALNIFYERWKENPVVLDTWFTLKASIPHKNALKTVKDLLDHPKFDRIAPNSLRAVLGGFSKNLEYFHADDGSGYIFIAEQIIEVDKRNPITASRLLKVFSKWKSHIDTNKRNMLKALEIINSQELSSNTREVIELIIN
ncbi:aminopeptidase N [Prochlorococcus sp. MIT 1223]|uniref:aminopeptidase N n=1 Tax=Prochlorococcus sp. MIT 1223 TaxID=3096217 RepID=UPI002A751329|nr:aminopeptidase N [Prochlorococcus sp. MIT 1223]